MKSIGETLGSGAEIVAQWVLGGLWLKRMTGPKENIAEYRLYSGGDHVIAVMVAYPAEVLAEIQKMDSPTVDPDFPVHALIRGEGKLLGAYKTPEDGMEAVRGVLKACVLGEGGTIVKGAPD